MTTEASLQHLARLLGRWTTEATHPAMPGVVVHGTVTVEWLEGERFLIHRARTDHPEFPDSISIIGHVDRDRADVAHGDALAMHYYDSRGVFRAYSAAFDAAAWRIWRDDPEFAQRFTGTYTDDGATIAGLWQTRQADGTWADDLAITYRRAGSAT
jgi:hypothetical protein